MALVFQEKNSITRVSGKKILNQNQFHPPPPRPPQKKKWLAPNCLFLSEFLKNGVCGYLKPK